MATLPKPSTFSESAKSPNALFELPVVLLKSALKPVAVFSKPVVLLKSALTPVAVLSWPVVMLKSVLTPVAVLLAPKDDDDLERLILGHSPRFQAFLENSWKKIKEGKGLSSNAFWSAVEKQAKKKTSRSRTPTALDAEDAKKQR